MEAGAKGANKSNLPTQSEAAAAPLPAIYGTSENLITVFTAPAMQRACALDPVRCYTGKAPTLLRISKEYGTETACALIEAQIQLLSEYAGVSGKVADHQSIQLATAILSQYKWLNAAELILFFSRFKAGCYGRFYGQIDPLLIMEGLHKFVRERGEELADLEQKARTARLTARREGVCTREEYLKLKERAARGDPAAIKALEPPREAASHSIE